MPKLFFTFFVIILSFLSQAQTDSTHTSTSKIILEKDHIIRLVLARDIGSSVAQTGNTVYFRVDSAVVVSGITVIPQGASAYDPGYPESSAGLSGCSIKASLRLAHNRIFISSVTRLTLYIS